MPHPKLGPGSFGGQCLLRQRLIRTPVSRRLPTPGEGGTAVSRLGPERDRLDAAFLPQLPQQRGTARTRRHLGAKMVVFMNHGEIGAAHERSYHDRC